MTRRELIEYCLSLPFSYEDYPFDDIVDARAWTVMRHRANNKGFAHIYERDGKLCVNLKCDPLEADFLRQVFADVTPAYHMNKTHWNTVTLGGDVPVAELRNMIEASYGLIKPKEKRNSGKHRECSIMSKKMVAYFSASGVTRKVAEVLAETVGADLYEITPQVPYTKSDLDWQNEKSRSSIEMSNPSSRPALADKNANVGAYATIFVGFPIWWYVAPTIINTFLESYDFTGKAIIPFATSGGSDLGETVAHLKKSVDASVTVMAGKMLNGRQTKESLASWVESLGI